MYCHLCHTHVPLAETFRHFLRVHPEVDAMPAIGPDGGVIWDEDFDTVADVA